MPYTIVLTKSGQMTLPKALRDLISVKIGDRLNADFKDGAIVVTRQKTLEEDLAELDTIRKATETPESRATREKYRGMTASEIRDAFTNSPEGKSYYKEKYGI